MNIIIFLTILLVLVLVHEWGHFFSAKKFGIRVDEFGFGFPPKLFSFKKGETEYSFNLIPFGGFVKIFGENPDEENINGPDKARSFVNKPKWQQAVVLFAGVFMNFVLAWILFSVGFMTGLPSSINSGEKRANIKDVALVVVSVSPDSPAEKAFLQTGDKIISLQAENQIKENPNPEELKNFINNNPYNSITVGYQRGRSELNYVDIVPTMKEGSPVIGIAMDEIGTAKYPFFTSLWRGLNFTLYMAKSTVIGFGELITGQASLDAVTGPVGLVKVTGDALSFGFVYLLSFAGLISINLAIINLVPFPALDGGRLFFLLIEAIKGSRMNTKVINIINLGGFFVLIGLMLFVTYKDIIKLF
jgi:regulator of sigma E protease